MASSYKKRCYTPERAIKLRSKYFTKSCKSSCFTKMNIILIPVCFTAFLAWLCYCTAFLPQHFLLENGVWYLTVYLSDVSVHIILWTLSPCRTRRAAAKKNYSLIISLPITVLWGFFFGNELFIAESKIYHMYVTASRKQIEVEFCLPRPAILMQHKIVRSAIL